jgi:hypothetical protein
MTLQSATLRLAEQVNPGLLRDRYESIADESEHAIGIASNG